jgi:hypothetical protein
MPGEESSIRGCEFERTTLGFPLTTIFSMPAMAG